MTYEGKLSYLFTLITVLLLLPFFEKTLTRDLFNYSLISATLLLLFILGFGKIKYFFKNIESFGYDILFVILFNIIISGIYMFINPITQQILYTRKYGFCILSVFNIGFFIHWVSLLFGIRSFLLLLQLPSYNNDNRTKK